MVFASVSCRTIPAMILRCNAVQMVLSSVLVRDHLFFALLHLIKLLYQLLVKVECPTVPDVGRAVVEEGFGHRSAFTKHI